MTRPPDAIIFDLDNTLVDDDHSVHAGLVAFHSVHGHGLGMPFETLRDHWRKLMDHYYPQYLSGTISLVEARRNRVRDLFRLAGRDLSDAEADAGFAVYRAEYSKSWRLYDDVLPALRALQGHRMAVLTNGGYATQTEKLEAAGLSSYFESLYASAELRIAKPAAEVFWTVCQKMGVVPANCVHVGDRFDLDALGAQGAGLRSVWLNRRGLSTPSTNGFTGETISTLLDLVPLIRPPVHGQHP